MAKPVVVESAPVAVPAEVHEAVAQEEVMPAPTPAPVVAAAPTPVEEVVVKPEPKKAAPKVAKPSKRVKAAANDDINADELTPEQLQALIDAESNR